MDIAVSQPVIPMNDGGTFPVRRIFCIGKNYADHVREMGGDPKDTPPVFFTKPADAACPGGERPFPLSTHDLHYEGELVVALGQGGEELSPDAAASLIYACAAGCDLTRRDRQREAKAKGAPWDLAKALDDGAMIGPLVRCQAPPESGAVRTFVAGTLRQDGRLEDMIWSVPEILSRLSRYFALKPGDLVFTGTPKGVGPVRPGEEVRVEIADLPPLSFTLHPRRALR